MKDNNHQDWSFGLKFIIYIMNNSVYRTHNKKSYKLVFGEASHGNSVIIDQLFKNNNDFSEDEIPIEFEGNIQKSVNNLDNLIDNTTSEINSSINLNQGSNLNEKTVGNFIYLFTVYYQI